MTPRSTLRLASASCWNVAGRNPRPNSTPSSTVPELTPGSVVHVKVNFWSWPANRSCFRQWLRNTSRWLQPGVSHARSLSVALEGDPSSPTMQLNTTGRQIRLDERVASATTVQLSSPAL